ncbi:S41 family peptidase [Sphingomonas sp. AOB5]|uniref:S41 family peptidase n=1 Tax=Sphingomonas sp. AOB5 TaxID=3034017 RepID=UPI0023F717D7|nr:S41 family peptidase [Sphingomonas sp. AOB5]MDF7777237.1 S41 family peptidase [Sphingomonas sp. AOB5]
MRGFGMTRRALCGAGLALVGSAAWGSEPERDITLGQDFDELWETLRDRYCFFHEKRTDWNKVRATYRPMAVAAESIDDFTAVLKRVLVELYDSHTNLRNAPDGTPRVPPFDLVVDAAARVTAVQEGSSAADAGLSIGERIVAVDGVTMAAAVAQASPRCLSRPDPAALLWSVNAAVSGRRAMARSLTVQSAGGVSREVAIPLKQRAQQPDVEGKRLDGGIGHIAIRSFGEMASIEAFDAALASLADAPALILDVRGNGGGDTAVARPIMGRFITERKPYARMRRRAGRGLSAAWTEYVDPRGPFTYAKPVIVLADHWSGSMAEGFPMGMRGLGRAIVVGTPMMQLGAAVFRVALDRTGIEAQYSAEPVYDVADRPRWLMQPDVAVADGQDLLTAALAEARRRAG